MIEYSKTVLDFVWRCRYSCINTTFFSSPKHQVVSWQHSLVYQKVRLLALIGFFSGLLPCSSWQNSMSGLNPEFELCPSSAGKVPIQTWAASLAMTDILHILTYKWLPGKIVCGSCQKCCTCWGIQYWQLGAAFWYLQPCGVKLENYLLHLCMYSSLAQCLSSTKLSAPSKVYRFVGLFSFGNRKAIGC